MPAANQARHQKKQTLSEPSHNIRTKRNPRPLLHRGWDATIRRMIVRRTISRSGEEYLYFFCRGTQDGFCDAKYSNVHRIERAVEEHYRTVQFSPDFLQAMRQTLDDALAEQEASQRALKE